MHTITVHIVHVCITAVEVMNINIIPSQLNCYA